MLKVLAKLKINLILENPVYSWKKSLNEKYTAPTGGRKAVLPETWRYSSIQSLPNVFFQGSWPLETELNSATGWEYTRQNKEKVFIRV